MSKKAGKGMNPQSLGGKYSDRCTVHLVRHQGCEEGLPERVFQILNRRAVSFYYAKGAFIPEGGGSHFYYSFEDYFHDCDIYRINHNVQDSDYVILLTGIPHDANWFSGMVNKNGFVQVNDWGLFFGANISPEFPVSYEVAAWVLRSAMCANSEDLLEHIHADPRGCLMDFCEHKQEIVLKMRTGDLCPQCLAILEKNRVSLGLINQVIATWEDVRKDMNFYFRAGFLNQPLNIDICFLQKEIHFRAPSVTVRLSPAEMALYALVLKYGNNPQGINLADLPGRPAQLNDLMYFCDALPYGNGAQFSPNHYNMARVQEHISRMRSKMESLLNNADVVTQYCIRNIAAGTYTIPISNDHVNWVDSQGNAVDPPWG